MDKQLLQTKPSIPYRCDRCGHKDLHEESWIDPSLYTNSDNAIKTTMFWCPCCEAPLSFKVKMLPEREIEIIKEIEYKTLLTENSPAFYISVPGQDNNDSDDESDSFELKNLSELEAIKLFSAAE